MELLVGAAVAGVIFGIVVLWIIWRAVSNVLDWIIYTFGNEEAVERLKKRRDSGSGRET